MMSKNDTKTTESKELKKGWTTGSCACAAAKAAYIGLVTGQFPETVSVTLPRGELPEFQLVTRHIESDSATASVIKDAGDDPDVTHGAEILATVTRGTEGSGITFQAGPGVGIVTKPGIPVAVGEPAINPGPRKIIRKNMVELAKELDGPQDLVIMVSIVDGEKLAQETLNPRLGIIGGLSVLGTTGVVVPFSCEAWIQSVQRTIEVARANGIDHIAGSTGYASERAVQHFYDMPDLALIDVGDFIGGMLKYLRAHPVPRLTISGGFAKLAKLAEGHLNVHSKASRVSMDALAGHMEALGAPQVTVDATRRANSAMEVLGLAEAQGIPIADRIAARCVAVCRENVRSETIVDVLVVNRDGEVVGHAG